MGFEPVVASAQAPQVGCVGLPAGVEGLLVVEVAAFCWDGAARCLAVAVAEDQCVPEAGWWVPAGVGHGEDIDIGVAGPGAGDAFVPLMLCLGVRGEGAGLVGV